MRLGSYLLTCRFETEAVLPVFKGSTIRGGLGLALKKTVCALKRQNCEDCLLAASCAYPFIYETGKGAARRPHPYVLEPPASEQRGWAPGETISFTLLLFGRANDYLPHLVYAVKSMGESGLGKDTASGQGKFALTEVRHGEQIVYDGKNLSQPAVLPEPACSATASPAPVSRLVISTITPLRLKADNHLQDELPFHLLIRAALRRISSLEAAYGLGEPALDYKGLVARAGRVEIESSSCRWMEIERYSSRQKTSMLIGGLMGRMVYAGDQLEEFLPLLRYCEKIHLGKQTAFGLGRIRIETEPPA